MSVRTTALLMMIGLGGTFLLRTLNSVWPALYASPLLARLVAIWFLVASLFALSFFWSVQSAWQGGGRAHLEAASRLATMGAVLAVFLRLRNFVSTLQEEGTVVPSATREIVPFLELIAALALFWFFYRVHVELADRILGTRGAVMGSGIFSLVAFLGFLVPIVPNIPRELAQLTGFLVLFSVLLGLLAVGGLLRFLNFVRRDPQALTEGR